MKTSTLIILSKIFGIIPIFMLLGISFVIGLNGMDGTADMHKMNWSLLMWVILFSTLGWTFILALLMTLGFCGKKLDDLDKLENDLHKKEEEVEIIKKLYTDLIEKINTKNH